MKICKRHSAVFSILRHPVRLFLRLRLGYTFDYAENLPDNYIVLSNHTTDYDPLLVAMSFRKHMYFVASEHITRWKLAYKLIRYFLSPIIRNKGTTASSTVMEILRTVRSGQRVCVFAEGARTWNGITLPILSSTGKMIKGSRCALVTYRIEGGYFASPRWSTHLRRGRLHGAPVAVYTAEQLAQMSADEINDIIARDLYEDAYARQLENPARYRGAKLAEQLENLFFCCPECGARDAMRSKGNRFFCGSCGAGMRYTKYGMLEGGRFATVLEYDRWQDSLIDLDAQNGAQYTAERAVLTELSGGGAETMADGELRVGPDGVDVGGVHFDTGEITDIAMHGKRAIVFSAGEHYCELKPVSTLNAIKFYKLFQNYSDSARINSMKDR